MFSIKLLVQILTLLVVSGCMALCMAVYAMCAGTPVGTQDSEFWGKEMYNLPKAEGYTSYPTDEEPDSEEFEGDQFSFPVVGKHYKEDIPVTGVITYDGNDMETVHAELVDTKTGRAFTAVGTWLTRDEVRVAEESPEGPDNAKTYILTIVEPTNGAQQGAN